MTYAQQIESLENEARIHASALVSTIGKRAAILRAIREISKAMRKNDNVSAAKWSRVIDEINR